MMYGPEISASRYVAFLVAVAVCGWALIEGGVWMVQHVTVGLR